MMHIYYKNFNEYKKEKRQKGKIASPGKRHS